jgi:7-carboxy-7-deazaguanine synthase (Cx14CxxC type)
VYAVKEVFRTLQGEGALAGTPMVFVRFAGCNLWSGREQDRAGARCDFCDTDFVGGDQLSLAELVDRVARAAEPGGPRWVCLSGGEPALQLDAPLADALHARGMRLAIETNGTIDLAPLRTKIDWLCVSPKTDDFVVRAGDELKLIYRGQDEAALRAFEALPFAHFALQPEWGARYDALLAGALAFLQRQSRWRLSLQVHKVVGLP